MRIFCATTNPGKLREFQRAAGDFGVPIEVEILPRLREIAAPHEGGSTFEENAAIKAEYYSSHAPGLVFADDSGLVVDALGGAPGVHSARYAGEFASDQANNALLLERMRGKTDRTARFVCVIALARDGKLIRTFQGAVEGELLHSERGTGGFGYDPLFYHAPFGCTLAEADPASKNEVSHRGQALRQLFEYLRDNRERHAQEPS